MSTGVFMSPTLIAAIVAGGVLLLIILRSLYLIGPTQVGLVNKRVSARGLHNDDPIAFKGEAGFQGQASLEGHAKDAGDPVAALPTEMPMGMPTELPVESASTAPPEPPS